MNIDPYEMEIKHITACVDLTDKRVLEIGCADGRLTRKIAQVAKEVIGIDPLLDTEFQASNYSLIKACANSLPFPNSSFDVVVCTLSLHHIAPEELSGSIDEVIRVCKKGATIVVLEPGFTGTYQVLEKDFGLGDGDETTQKLFAQNMIKQRSDLKLINEKHFTILFEFTTIKELEDWFEEKLCEACKQCLNKHKTKAYTFDMQRILYVFEHPAHAKHP